MVTAPIKIRHTDVSRGVLKLPVASCLESYREVLVGQHTCSEVSWPGFACFRLISGDLKKWQSVSEKNPWMEWFLDGWMDGCSNIFQPIGMDGMDGMDQSPNFFGPFSHADHASKNHSLPSCQSPAPSMASHHLSGPTSGCL